MWAFRDNQWDLISRNQTKKSFNSKYITARHYPANMQKIKRVLNINIISWSLISHDSNNLIFVNNKLMFFASMSMFLDLFLRNDILSNSWVPIIIYEIDKPAHSHQSHDLSKLNLKLPVNSLVNYSGNLLWS